MALDTSRPVMQSIGSYDLIEKVAEGGMGSVYRAKHQLTGQIVAIKIMPPHMAGNPVLLKRFEQEFRAASLLDHPNIVRAIEYQDSGTAPYLVMEFVEGESLGQKIERDGRMSESDSIRIVAQVAQGLHRAHKQGMIHRDVKPDNVMVTPEGQAKLADLGLVKEIEADLNLTRTGRGLGTPHFMAPEQFRNAKNADVRCDIYALGATLYMMVTGELPFRSNGPLDAWMKKIHNELTPPRDIVPDLSERVDWAIRRAMSADPDQRPNTCREFIEDLTGHSTRKITPAENSGTNQDLWYLVYKDEIGATHTVKGTYSAIRRSLKEGLLGDASNVRASRLKTGPFDPLRSFPEFRDLVVAPPVRESLSATRLTPPPVADSNLRHRPIPPSRPSTPAEPPAGPHIDMTLNANVETSPQTVEGLMWLAILLVVALVTAFAGYYWLLPNL